MKTKKKKKRAWSKKFYEIRCESTKSSKIRSVNTNLGVSEASICTPIAPSRLICSGHSPRLGWHNFRLGGAQALTWGGTAPECPPRGAGLDKNFFHLAFKKTLRTKPCRLSRPIGLYFDCSYFSFFQPSVYQLNIKSYRNIQPLLNYCCENCF